MDVNAEVDIVADSVDQFGRFEISLPRGVSTCICTCFLWVFVVVVFLFFARLVNICDAYNA